MSVRIERVRRCPQCGSLLVASIRSVLVDDSEVRHLLVCEDCGCPTVCSSGPATAASARGAAAKGLTAA